MAESPLSQDGGGHPVISREMRPTMGSSDAVDPARDCRRLLAMAQPERMRLVFLGFDDESPAYSVLDLLKSGIAKKDVVVWDRALLKTDPDGKVKITTDKSVDPGAARGAALGGAAGLVLAALSGPIGVGAVLGGAALGSVTAAMKDSGFKNEDLEAVSHSANEPAVKAAFHNACREAAISTSARAAGHCDPRHSGSMASGRPAAAARRDDGCGRRPLPHVRPRVGRLID
jgi:uncharacterized membrane protein